MDYNAKQLQLIVREVVGETFNLPLEEVALEAHLYRDLGMDSLDVVNIVVSLEERLGIDIPNEVFRYVEPGLGWRMFRLMTTMHMRFILDKLRFSQLIFYREIQIEDYATRHGVAPFTLGFLSVCVEEYLKNIPSK